MFALKKVVSSIQISLLLMTIAISSAFAEENIKIYNTADFTIPLPKTMQLLKTAQLETPKGVAHVYLYGANYPDAQVALTINSFRNINEIGTAADRAQRQFIAGTVDGFQRKKGLYVSPKDKFNTYNNVRSVRLKNNELKTYLINQKNGLVEIYTTVKNNSLYGFVITCYGNEANANKKYLRQMLTQIDQIQIK